MSVPDHRRILLAPGGAKLVIRACFVAPTSGTRILEENHVTLAIGAEPTVELVGKLASELEARAHATAAELGLPDLRPMTAKETEAWGLIEA